MRLHWMAIVGLIGLLGGCGGPPSPAPPPQPATPATLAPGRPAPPPVALPKEPELKPLSAIAYEAKGRRDPFAAPAEAEGAKGLSVASMKLVGIVHGRKERLALVEAPDGLGYILRRGDLIADGRVVEIGRDSLTLAVIPKPGAPLARLVLRLRTE